MTDRNRWDEDRRWRSSSSDYRDNEDDRYRRSDRGYGSERQYWEQDYPGESASDHSWRDRSWNDEASRRAGGSYRSYEGSDDYGSRRTESERYGSGRTSYGGRSSTSSQRPHYDEGGEFQTSNRRYTGTGYSAYGAGPSASTGDYFTGSDYGSGAHTWDRNSTQSRAGSGRYGSTYSQTGFSGALGSTASYAPGSRDQHGGYQSHQRESGSYRQQGGAEGTYGRAGTYAPGSGYARNDYGQEERGFLEKASDEVMSWFGDEDAARRREQDHRGHGPSDYTRSDERVREDANDRLTDDYRVDARKISVTVQDGELTLSGTVPNRMAKHRAEECVENISGVRHVQNNLRVDTNAGNSLSATSDWGTSTTGRASSDTTASATGAAGSKTAGSSTSSATSGTGTSGASTTTPGNTGATSRGSTTGSTSA